MPAYFNLTIEFNRYEIDYDTVKVFYASLKNAGLKFKSGYWKSEKNTLDEIIEHNQKLLEDDFVLGADEDVSHSYKQILFKFGDYTHVRGLFTNRSPVKGEYEFSILIPEEEIADHTADGYVFKDKAIGSIIELAKKIWYIPTVHTIQTGLEHCDAITSEADIREGKLPSMYPFAIVSERHFSQLDSTELESEKIAPGGYLLMPKSKVFK